jgi:lambda repressor-like predicted transcriptional regulator
VSVVCCQEEVSASGRSLVQKSPTECGVSECDCESSVMRRPCPTGSWCAMVKKSIPVSRGLSIRQYSLFDQLSSNTFRPKLGQLQALKIQNTLRKTFNGQGGYYHNNSGFSGR